MMNDKTLATIFSTSAIIFFLNSNIYANDINIELKNLQDDSEKLTSLNLGKRKIDVTLSKTKRGNGTILILNSLIRLYDERVNTYVYSKKYLKLDTIDLDSDGTMEIIISGVAFPIDDETGEPTGSIPVVFIYKVDISNNNLIEIYRNCEFDIILNR